MPYATYLRTNQPKFYAWLAAFLRNWLDQSVIFTIALFVLLVGGSWLFNESILHAPSFLFDRWEKFAVYIYVFSVISTAFIGFSFAKAGSWDNLILGSEPAARMLVGNDEYEALPREDKQKVLRNIAEAQIGINKATLVVSGGELIIKEPPAADLAKFGGPGVLVVQEGHAVVLEQRGSVSRVVGKGVTFLQMFERVSMVVPLNPRAERPIVRNLITQDQVVVSSIRMLVLHRVRRGPNPRENGMYPFEEEIIRREIWSPSGNDWRELIRSVAESTLRDITARHSLEDLLLASGTSRQALRDEITTGMNRVMNGSGVDVLFVDLGEIELPKDVSDKMWKRWHATVDRQIQVTEAEKQRDIMVRKAEADSKSRRSIEDVKADLVRRLTDPIREMASKPGQNPEIIKQYFELIEKLTLEIVHDDVAALRYVEALEKASESGAQKTVIWGDPKTVLKSSTQT